MDICVHYSFLIMKVEKICLIIICLVLCGSARDSNFCDKSDNIKMPEGNVGQTANFPWLGILRVQLREPYSKNYRVAVTGVVLIKLNYALAVSKDIAKIPKHILLDDSNVLFISTVNTTTYVKVKDCLHHPEHEVLTLNTITIIELEITKNFTVKPICWLRANLNTKRDLYSIGYTDIHKVFEKEIHKMLYFDKQMCDEFYIRSNLNEELKTPTRYECAFAVHNEGACVVENGMAIVSNASGYWMLIGLSLHGPGCAAPNRFIELSTFLPWLTRSTDDADVISDEKYRRSFDAGKAPKVLPVHALFRADPPRSHRDYTYCRYPMMCTESTRTKRTKPRKRYFVDLRDVEGYDSRYYDNYWSPTWQDKYLKKHLKIDHFAPGKARIKFNKILEYGKDSCKTATDLIYNDIIEIKNSEHSEIHRAEYGLSLYDILYQNVTCFKVDIDSYSREKVIVWHEPAFHTYPTKIEQPPELISGKYIPPIDKFGGGPLKQPTPNFIRDTVWEKKVSNVHIIIRFKYKEKAKMVLQLYGTKLKKILRAPGHPFLQEITKLKRYEHLQMKAKFRGPNDLHRLFWSDEEVDDDGVMIPTVAPDMDETSEDLEIIELKTEKPPFDTYTVDSKESFRDITMYNNHAMRRAEMNNFIFILSVIGGVVLRN